MQNVATEIETKKGEIYGPETKEKEYIGLCSTCLNDKSCMFARSLEHPILQCEEFEIYEPNYLRYFSNEVFQENNSQNIEEIESNKFKGLCSNCEDRQICTHYKPETGIWHCEDYQ
jgi:hypothetical protein